MARLALALQQRILQKPMKNNIERETDFKVFNISDYKYMVDLCIELQVDIVLMEVKVNPPWDLQACLNIVNKIRQQMPDCMIVFLCDAKNNNLGEAVAKSKREGLIDAFVFSDITYEFLIATLQSL